LGHSAEGRASAIAASSPQFGQPRRLGVDLGQAAEHLFGRLERAAAGAPDGEQAGDLPKAQTQTPAALDELRPVSSAAIVGAIPSSRPRGRDTSPTRSQ
jgi:hypothetical protein